MNYILYLIRNTEAINRTCYVPMPSSLAINYLSGIFIYHVSLISHLCEDIFYVLNCYFSHGPNVSPCFISMPRPSFRIQQIVPLLQEVHLKKSPSI
jgi:hypothetical protein